MENKELYENKGKKLSPYFRIVNDGKGQGTYDPQQLYQYLFDNTDRNMVLLYTIGELADAVQISRETLSYFFKDIKDLGFIEKIGFRSGWRLLKKPDQISWDKDLYDKLKEMRKWHQKVSRDKLIEEGFTREDLLNGRIS